MLTSTITTPLYGKLSDMYGRKPMFVVSILIFLVGSCLCGLSGSMTQLVVFRGIQGLGAGGLITLAQTTIADLVTPRERGRYQGLFGAVFAFSSIAGPLLGGVITDAVSWRWIFYINLPIGALALALIAFGFRRPQRVVAHSVDYQGVVLLSAWTSTLLLVLTWGGVTYPWSSPTIIGLSTVSTLFFCLLVRRERRAAEPVFSPGLFRNKVFVIASSVLGLTFMAFLGAAVFMPLFFQLVLGYSASRAGLLMAPMTVGMIVSSAIGGRLVTKTGLYKIFPIVGLALSSCALLGIMWASTVGAGLLILEVAQTVLGLGLGLVMPNLTVAIQNAVEPGELGMATAMAGFFRSLGGAFGVAMSGAIVTARLHNLQLGAGAGGARSLIEQGIRQIAELPVAQKDIVLAAYRNAISTTFLVGAIIAVVAFAMTVFLPEKPLKSTRVVPEAEPEVETLLGVPEMEGT